MKVRKLNDTELQEKKVWKSKIIIEKQRD